MKKTGLTLGKFAPLHRGHQLVIETALAEMDELVVLVYDTSVTSVPLSVRAGWIRRLYPSARVIECWDGPEDVGDDPGIMRKQEEYILSILDGLRITHFYSSEFYGEHVARALGAADRRVDAARNAVPVSGTAVRRDPYAHRRFVSDAVYADLITRVVFVGAMGTGKTTIAEALAGRFATTWAKEYGREYWETHQVDRRFGLDGFDAIALEHIRREDAAALEANRYLFVDTNAITTYMFALDYHGRAPERLTRIAMENGSRYDLFFLCGDDIPYDDTWDRSGDQKRHVFQKQIVADLDCRRIPYIVLRGPLAERMAKVEAVLAGFEKYANYFGAGR